MKKKIISLIICLLMVNIVAAIDEFEITLIAYNSETQSAQIGIKNIGSEDYHNITMAIDDLTPRYVVGLIRQGSVLKVPKGVPPGKHTITISTADGITAKKEIDFAKSESQIREELQAKQVKEVGVSGEKKELRVYEKEKKKSNKTPLIIISLLLLVLIFYFLYKKKKEKGGKRKNKTNKTISSNQK